MAYRVRWQLVGRSGQPLDGGCVGEDFRAYGDAVAAVVEFLRPYPEVSRCSAESYWLARRSRDADLAVWTWVECHAMPSKGAIKAVSEWPPLRQRTELVRLTMPDAAAAQKVPSRGL